MGNVGKRVSVGGFEVVQAERRDWWDCPSVPFATLKERVASIWGSSAVDRPVALELCSVIHAAHRAKARALLRIVA